MLGSIDRNAHCLTNKIKIHFSIDRHVPYGRGIYVVGDCLDLGMWSIASSFRLNWNEGDQWSGTIELDRRLYQKIQFKYVIGDWNNPSDSSCQWEEGFRNRKLCLETHRNSIVCRIQQIQLRSQVGVGQNNNAPSYKQSGSRRLVLRDRKYSIARLMEVEEEDELYEGQRVVSLECTSQQKIMRAAGRNSLFLYFFRQSKSKEPPILLYQKNRTVVAERHPGRMLDLNNLDAKKHPECHQISSSTGDIQILQTCKFNQLNFSKITEKIYVGAYLRTSKDLQRLKQKGINTVFSIQSKQDYTSHCLSPDYLKALCLTNGIDYHSYSIRDMNAEEFIQKCLGAFLLLRNLLTGDNNKVYVHCSAGIYRSPQIIVVYLVLVDGYGLDEAIEMVREKHPFARPNYTVLSEALNQISKGMSRLIIQF